MLAALRYRWVQGVIVFVLASFVCACLAFATVYSRAVDQAVVRAELERTPAPDRGVRLVSFSTSDPFLAMHHAKLQDLVPAALTRVLGDGIATTSVGVRRMPLAEQPEGRLVWRAGMCEHVRFVAGRCPVSAGEIAVSTEQARVHEMPVGSSVRLGEWDASVSRVQAAPWTLAMVVAVYEQLPDPFWFGDRLTGRAADGRGYDVMLTAQDTLEAPVRSPEPGMSLAWTELHYGLDLPLRPGAVDADDIDAIGRAAADWVTYPLGVERYGTKVSDAVLVRTALPQVAAEVRASRAQAHVTIPLLMGQLALLLCTALWLVLVAAADQRRGEVAVARLRGRGAPGVRRLLLAETLPPIVLAVPAGLALAWVFAAIARHTVLAPAGPAQFPPGTVWAALVALLVMTVLAALSVERVVRIQVSDLLRSVPAARSRATLGLLEAALVVASLTAFLALVTGAVEGPLGQLAPLLLAVAAGVLAARVVPALLNRVGGLVMTRGRFRMGTAFVHAGRRPATRWVIPTVTVTLAVVVLAADLLAIGAANRLGRARAEVGASTVLTLDTNDVRRARTAIAQVDPAGTRLTPVVLVDPPAGGVVTTVGVIPHQFRRIAAWPGVDAAAAPWETLAAPSVAPLTLTGDTLTYRVTMPALDTAGADADTAARSVGLAVQVVGVHGQLDTLPLGVLDTQGTEDRRRAALPCPKGCRVVALGVTAPLGAAPLRGTLTLTDVRLDGRPVDLGTTRDWVLVRDGDIAVTSDTPGLTVAFATRGRAGVFVRHGALPLLLPALTTPAAAPSDPQASIGGALADGTDQLLRSAGTLAFVPGGPARAAVVDLDTLLTRGWQGRGSAHPMAYAASGDPAVVTELIAALGQQGVRVSATTTPAQRQQIYDRTGATWSLRLSMLTAVLAQAVAAVALLVLVAASWRVRSRDFAGLQLAGLTSRDVTRIAVLETVPAVTLAGLLGIAVGLWSAPAAVAMVPIFTSAPTTFPIDLSTLYAPSLAAGGASLLFLTLVAALASWFGAQRSSLSCLRSAE